MRRSPDPLFTAAFVSLTGSDLAYFTAGGALIGVTPFFVTGPLGAGPVAVGITFAAFSVTTLILRPLAGRWTDRHGRRPLLIGGAALFSLLVLGHLLVTDLGWLLALRLLMGVAEALYFVAGFAALADLAPPGRAGEALSYNSLALFLGIAIGPALGQALLGLGGFPVVWAGITLVLVLATALATRVPETHVPATERLPAAPLVHRAALVPGLGLFTGVAGVAGFLAFASLRSTELGLHLWSVTLALFGVVVVTCRIAFATLPDRVPPLRLAAASLGAAALGLVVTATVPAAWGLFLGATVLGVGTAFLTPAVFAAIFSRVPESQRGSAAGTASVFIDLGFSGGPVMFGLVAAASGIPAAFVAGAVVAAGGGALLAFRHGSAAPLTTDR
jgi:MFS family permease